MIKCISYWSIPDGLAGTCSIDDAADAAKNAGFAGIELAIAPTGVLTPETDEATCTAYRKAVEARGLVLQTLASGMSWGCSPTALDPATRRKSIDMHRAALQRAKWLGCSSMLFVPGAVSIPWDDAYGPIPYAHAFTWAGEAVASLIPTAEQLGVELCVENVWNGLFYSPLEYAAFLNSFRTEIVGAYFDVGNVLGYHQAPQHWIEILGARVKRVHIKDFKRSVGTLAGFCDLLEGDVPWAQTMSALKAIGYDKTVVAEMLPPAPGLLERTSRAMDKILSL